MRIEWDRCAEPQDDEHDTDVIWNLVTTTVTPIRRQIHRRRLPEGSPTIFDGAVAVRYFNQFVPGYPRNDHGRLDHPNIWAAADYVRRWPQAYLQFRRLMDSFHPMIDRNVPESEYNIRLGSNSHSDEPMFGAMYASYFDPLGTAEAMVHEMAHNKLRGLGVYVEWAQRIITNPPDELFESPIRKDVLRPMTAVLHAQYSFIHVTQLDLKMIAAETDETMIPKMLFLLAANVPRMEEGFDEMRRNAKLDATGELFMDAFNRWSDKVIEEGNRLLEKHGVAKHATMRVTAND